MNQHALIATAATFLLAFIGTAWAQPPADIATRIRADGPMGDFGKTMGYYAPLHAAARPDLSVQRDVRYGPAERNVADVYATGQKSSAPRPALIFVHGGAFIRGDKSDGKNIGVWAANSGYVGVLINYPLAPQHPWPAGAQDIGVAITWLQRNASTYGIDPQRIFLMGHSAGTVHVASYLSHPELQPGSRPGVAGAILVSGFYDLLANEVRETAYFGTDATQYRARSSQDGLVAGTTPLLIVSAELEPPLFTQAAPALKAALDRKGRKATLLLLKGHNHMSEIAAINTADTDLSGAVQTFIQGNRQP